MLLNTPILKILITEIMYKPRREEEREKFDRVNKGFYMEEGDDLVALELARPEGAHLRNPPRFGLPR